MWGYQCQTHTDFEIIIADDGSGPETENLIKTFQQTTSLNIQHVWHEDQGYRRQTILNKAILKAQTEYVIFTDGDCIPRKDFINTHIAHAKEGHFLSGGYCKLPMNLSEKISHDDITTQRCFELKWLKSYGEVGMSQSRKLFVKGNLADFFDFITPAKPTFNNSNSSAWKADLLKVNGYDERMLYGGSDREIGERLVNSGVVGKQIRHRAIVLHLDHPRAYKTQESLDKNMTIRKATKRLKIKWTPHGIQK